ncbi:helix-turn-helix domain-containing protein [Streptomyces sp. DSM 42041]|uniref:Helix-turn-helix domain-containing protein n=1 Tax=Streptomyces hazeniae TaxID=3075538 RepID=A0ABU2NY62_9ACTN|nr:helix-turn-helix domain-containing protein [Streptomyces sp. DSM 42041]MDT0381913.1 helix-turn-helix domain-containing protein [Streptomyces sp. DSM 42041]
MTKTRIPSSEALPPDSSRVAHEATRRVRDYLQANRQQRKIRVTVEGEDRRPLELPREAVELLAGMLAHMGAGRSVAIVPRDAELTTQQAADLLNVSRPFLIGLLEAGEIEYRTVGTHRRITASSLLGYKARDDQRRRHAADELTELGQDMGLI